MCVHSLEYKFIRFIFHHLGEFGRSQNKSLRNKFTLLNSKYVLKESKCVVLPTNVKCILTNPIMTNPHTQ